MKFIIIVLLCLSAGAALAEETTIRVLGVYQVGAPPSSSKMTTQMQGIVNAWNNTGLPAASATTVQLLNNGTAVPIAYVPEATTLGTASTAYSNASLQGARNAYRADVVIVFTNNEDICGGMYQYWGNGNHPATGIDTRSPARQQYFVAVVNGNTGCPDHVGAHEFGHLLGGGHASSGPAGLYSDSRAHWQFVLNEIDFSYFAAATAIVDAPDVPSNLPIVHIPYYSTDGTSHGSPTQNNARALTRTARSAANLFQAQNPPTPILNPPINHYGYFLDCQNGWTGHAVYWTNDPATNVPVTHYHVYKSQPVGQPDVYGWSVYTEFTTSYVIGASSRNRVRACSGDTCSALSASFYDAWINPACNW